MPEQDAPRLDTSQSTDDPSELHSPSQPSQTNGPKLSPGYSPVLSPAQPVPVASKKPIFFPITRNAPLGKQLLTMLLYSLLLVILFTGSTLFLSLALYNLRATYSLTTNPFVNPDGTVNGSLILAMVVFFFLIIPLMTLLCGALFGAVRAFLITSISESTALVPIGLLLQAYMHFPFYTLDPPLLSFFLAMPFIAGIVGFFYDRRLYASWGKSFLTLLLGSAIFILWLLVFSLAESQTVISSSQDSTVSYTGAGCFWIIASPLLALPVAGIEGGIHSIIARYKKSQAIDKTKESQKKRDEGNAKLPSSLSGPTGTSHHVH